MLSVETAKKIGINACIDKLGRDFVLSHRDCATSAYGESEYGVFCFVGVDDKFVSQNSDKKLILDSCSKFSYRASYNVSLIDGSQRFIECVSPKNSI